MYQKHFGFTDKPFALTPDPRFLFLSQHHQEALAHLLFGMGEGGGFVQLTGEVGTGKTTLCRSVLEQTPQDVDLALILNPNQTPAELVGSICDELEVQLPTAKASLKVRVDHLNRRLLDGHAAGRRTVVVIDEAQNLSRAALEQIRLLTNLETATCKLLQMVLIGQPELQHLMARDDLRQLAQRITARYHLPPLAREETIAYIRHRLRVAGGASDLFTRRALLRVHRLSGGIPRLINIICDRALLGAYARERRRVQPALVRDAWREVRGTPRGARRRHLAARVTAAALAAGAATAGWLHLHPPAPPASPSVPAAVSGPPAIQIAPRNSALPQDTAAPAQAPAAALMDALQQVAASREDALLALLAHWVTPADTLAGSACATARDYNLRCFQSRGTWTRLLRDNRPAVLELLGPSRERYYALLIAATDQQLTFHVGTETLTLSRDAVDPFWYGSYTSLWALPPGGRLLLEQGTVGSEVHWLRQQLARVYGSAEEDPAPPRRATFDAALRQQVETFQRDHGLDPDGKAGRETIMALNAAVPTPSVPRLQSAPNRMGEQRVLHP